jgi:hypothetical protein
MKYLDPKFSVGLASKEFRDGYDKIDWGYKPQAPSRLVVVYHRLSCHGDPCNCPEVVLTRSVATCVFCSRPVTEPGRCHELHPERGGG